MTRRVESIDKELRLVHNRRETNRSQISRLSLAIVSDTALIDRLLAERSVAKTEAEAATFLDEIQQLPSGPPAAPA